MENKSVLDHPVMRWIEFLCGTLGAVVVFLMDNPGFVSPLGWKIIRFACFAGTVYLLAYHILPGMKHPSERDVVRRREMSDRLNKLVGDTSFMARAKKWDYDDIDAFLQTQPDFQIVRHRMKKLEGVNLWGRIGGPNVHPRVLELEKVVAEHKRENGLPD